MQAATTAPDTAPRPSGPPDTTPRTKTAISQGRNGYLMARKSYKLSVGEKETIRFFYILANSVKQEGNICQGDRT